MSKGLPNRTTAAYQPARSVTDKARLAVAAALEIKSDMQKSKALIKCIDSFLTKQDYQSAFDTSAHIHLKTEKAKAFHHIVDELLDTHSPEEAIHAALAKIPFEEREIFAHEAILKLADTNRIEEALDMAEKLGDRESASYTASTIVRMLAAKGEHKRAGVIARNIPDEGARGDAYEYILKALVFCRRFEEACRLVESIKEPFLKNAGARFLESAMRARHQDDKVQRVRRQFALFIPGGAETGKTKRRQG